MAIKFPKTRPEKGEVVHPDDLLENFGEVVNELNGNIDSDNIDGSLHKDSFKAGSFHKIYSFKKHFSTIGSTTVFNCPNTTSGYVKRDDDNVQLAGVEFDAATDGWAIIDFNCTWLWTGNGIVNAEMANDVLVGYLLNEGTDGLTHMTAGGGNVPRTDMPPGGWMGFCGEGDELSNPNKWADYTKVLETSTGREITEFYVANFPLGQWSDVPVDFYAVQFRIVINGTVVSESGPLFNGNWRNSVYLCGATPVVAGKNNIDVEVRAYTAVELKTSRVGIGARDEQDNRGELFPYQRTSSEVHPAPLPEFKKDSLDLLDTDFAGPKDTGSILISTGIKCDIADRLLLVQFRKR